MSGECDLEGCHAAEGGGKPHFMPEVHKKMMDNNKLPTSHRRREFLYLATGVVAAGGAAFTVWPLIAQLGPNSSSIKPPEPIELDLTTIGVGEARRFVSGGWLLALYHQTPDDVAASKAIAVESMPDKLAQNANLDHRAAATVENRSLPFAPEFVLTGLNCTREGCVVITSDARLTEGSVWHCPCCGGKYDSLGRAMSYPVKMNLPIPAYERAGETRIRLPV